MYLALHEQLEERSKGARFVSRRSRRRRGRRERGRGNRSDHYHNLYMSATWKRCHPSSLTASCLSSSTFSPGPSVFLSRRKVCPAANATRLANAPSAPWLVAGSRQKNEFVEKQCGLSAILVGGENRSRARGERNS